MKDLTDRALDTAAQLGASYADVRVVRRRDESISIKSGRVEGVAMGETDGFGVRVLVDGAWGFAASDTLELEEADRVGALAVRIAQASATALKPPVELDGRPPATGTYETPVVEDPFKLPLEAKISDLMAADRAAGRVRGVTFTESIYAADRASGRRSPRPMAASPSRSSPRSAAVSRRTPSTATSTSAGATPTAAAATRRRATSTSAASTSPGTPAAMPRRLSSSCPRRSALPGS